MNLRVQVDILDPYKEPFHPYQNLLAYQCLTDREVLWESRIEIVKRK